MNVEYDGFRIGSDSLTLHDSFRYYFSPFGFFVVVVVLFCLFVCLLHFLSLLGPNSSQAIVSLVACL